MQHQFSFVTLSPELAARLKRRIDESSLSVLSQSFLILSIDACGTNTFPTVAAKLFHTTQLIVVDCIQKELARLLRCCDRDIRDVRVELETANVVRTTRTKPTEGPNRRPRNVYSISINRCLNLPVVQRSDAIELAIMATDGDPFNDREMTGKMTGQMTGEMTGPMTGRSPGNDREVTGHGKHSTTTHGHDVFLNCVRFSDIPSNHVVEVRNGNAELFSLYFADVVAAGWGKDCDADRLMLASLFVHASRVAKKNPGGFINSAWKRRGTKPITLSNADEQSARAIAFPRSTQSTKPSAALDLAARFSQRSEVIR